MSEQNGGGGVIRLELTESVQKEYLYIIAKQL
jgi:hypothetical protein